MNAVFAASDADEFVDALKDSGGVRKTRRVEQSPAL